MLRSDIETVYESGRETEAFRVSDTPGFWSRKQLNRWLDNPDDVLLVAEDNKRVIGYVMSQLHKPTGKATIENLFVDESYRKKGIGSDLIKRCLKELKERGASYFCAMVRTDNDKITNFYERCGFTRGYNFVWMEREK